MVSRVEKVIYNPYLCYIPIILIALFFSAMLVQISPTKCLFGSSAQQCLFYNQDASLLYHPLNIINAIFTIYNILYVYYNVFLKKDIVGKSVKKIYTKTTRHYYIRKKRKRITILLFCYITALMLSYVRFPITLLKTI